jgi:hypothetical protein
VGITGVAGIKRQAKRAHASQLLLRPYDECVMGLNRFRGLQVARLGENEVRYGEGYAEMDRTGFKSLCESIP